MDKDATLESNDSADSPVKIKEEPRDDIKSYQELTDTSHKRRTFLSGTTVDFAETTMNELLGWYGYDKVDSQDTQNLNLNRFSSQDSDEDGDEDMDNVDDLESTDSPQALPEGASHDSMDSDTRLSIDSPGSGSDLAAQHQALVSALNGSQSTPKSPTDTLEGAPQPASYIVCAWCQKPGVKLFTLKSCERGSKAFCSELCFTQCRRASFKKNKVCDWCKHVRHTVNYVDFQDGEQQLQFCSDKCLNQYKMNIFCKETQEHLQQIQNQIDTGSVSTTGNANQILITPELWMQNRPPPPGKNHRESVEHDTPLNLQKNEDKKNGTASKEIVTVKREREKQEDIGEMPNHDEESETLLNHKRLKIDKDKLKQIKNRESTTTPLSITTNQSSSQMSTPASSSSNLTPPMSNGPTFTAAVGGNLLGSLGPAAMSHQPLFFQSLFAGLPGVFPPGMMLTPEHQQRPSGSTRVSTSEAGANGPRSASQASPGHSTTPKPSPTLPSTIQGARLPMTGIPPLPPINPFTPGLPLPGAPPSLIGPNLLSGIVPPATTLIPYPIFIPLVLPMPIPIPIPIPFTSDGKIPASPKKDKASKSESEKLDFHVKNSSPDLKLQSSDSSSPVPSRRQEQKSSQRIQCACCQSETPDASCSSVGLLQHGQNGETDEKELLRVVLKPPVIDMDCSVAAANSDMDDVVIDLSKEKNKDPQPPTLSMPPHSAMDKGPTALLRASHCSLSASSTSEKVPTTNSLLSGSLHTVTGAPLPPPQNHAYSSRRALLLDAPSIPRDRTRSPSPDRRLLLRNPTRDMLFGKRRCMRTRIKTK